MVDFDGRATLHDVHNTIQRELDLDNDHLYAFYLSGRYFDVSSEHGPSQSRHDSCRSVLFRLGLSAGQRFAYLFDFGDELRHAITVVSIAEVEAPLGQPALVESVGEAPSLYGHFEDDEAEPYELPEHLAEVAPLAEAVLALSERLDELYEEDDAKHPPTSEDDTKATSEERLAATSRAPAAAARSTRSATAREGWELGVLDSTCPWVASGAEQGAKFIAIERGTDNGCTVPGTIPVWQSGDHVCYDMLGCGAGHPTKVCTFNGGHVSSAKDTGSSTNWIAQQSWEFVSQF